MTGFSLFFRFIFFSNRAAFRTSRHSHKAAGAFFPPPPSLFLRRDVSLLVARHNCFFFLFGGPRSLSSRPLSDASPTNRFFSRDPSPSCPPSDRPSMSLLLKDVVPFSLFSFFWLPPSARMSGPCTRLRNEIVSPSPFREHK